MREGSFEYENLPVLRSPSPTTALVNSILQEINAQWPSHEQVVELFKIMKSQFKGNFLPCQVNKDDPKHRYHSAGGRERFRLRCAVCRHTLTEQEALRYFAQLVHDGAVDRSAIGLTPTVAMTNNPSEEPELATVQAENMVNSLAAS